MATNVFVLMPFGNNDEYQGGNLESNYVFDEIITPGVRLALGEKCEIVREVDKNLPGSITDSIVRNIVTSDVVIVDITGWNPNVFFELGIRYALRNKTTVVLAQEGTDPPFDIRGYRLVQYERFAPQAGRNKIAEFIKTGMSDEVVSDSIVFDTFRNLSVQIPGRVESHGQDLKQSRIIMSWDEYMARIAAITQWLRPAVVEGKYVPHAVLGISNGGLIVADLIGKAVFAGMNTPILALWAQRFTRNDDYFENAYNQGVVGVLKSHGTGGIPADLLLLDDHFGSGNTSRQAIDYLKKELGPATQIVFIPLVSRRIEYIRGMEEFFPYRQLKNGECPFRVTEEEFVRSLDTQAHYFPYLHKQVSEGLEHIAQ